MVNCPYCGSENVVHDTSEDAPNYPDYQDLICRSCDSCFDRRDIPLIRRYMEELPDEVDDLVFVSHRQEEGQEHVTNVFKYSKESVIDDLLDDRHYWRDCFLGKHEDGGFRVQNVNNLLQFLVDCRQGYGHVRIYTSAEWNELQSKQGDRGNE